MEQWSKEGEEGFKKTTKLTRMLTVALAFIQACGMAYGLKMAINNPGIFSILLIALTLTAGTVFLMWIGEQITGFAVWQWYFPDNLCRYRIQTAGLDLR